MVMKPLECTKANAESRDDHTLLRDPDCSEIQG